MQSFQNLFRTPDEEEPLEPTVHSRLTGNDNETNDNDESGIWNRLKGFISTSEPETVSTNDPFFASLSYQTRFLGFLSCFIAGFVLSFFSSFVLMTGNVRRFSFIYTVGNSIALVGSGFLMGPSRQLESMFDDTRRISTTVYLSCLVLTIYFAFIGKSILIVMPILLIQWCAGVWYTASYVPYGRTAIKGFANKISGLNL